MAAKSEAIPRPRAESAHALARVLADTYLLYGKTHNFHWNVEGPAFPSLHRLFEEQYRALWSSVDELAERIRALGPHAPGTYAKIKALAAIKETEEIPDSDAMLEALLADHETLVHTVRAALGTAQAAGDEVTADLLTDRLSYHEKQIWMIRSTLAA